MRRTRVVRLTTDTIVQMLGVPEGGRVVAVTASHDPWAIDIVLEHPAFDEVPDEMRSPVVPGGVRVKVVEGQFGEVYRRWELEP